MSGERVKLRESDIQGAVLHYLEFERNAKRLMFRRKNTGAHLIQDKEDRKRMVRYGKPGDPDIMVWRFRECGMDDCCPADGCVRSECIAIELKAIDGKQTKEQKEFQEEFESNGGIYVLARSVDDVIKVLG